MVSPYLWKLPHVYGKLAIFVEVCHIDRSLLIFTDVSGGVKI
jgi:hypothetical protein